MDVPSFTDLDARAQRYQVESAEPGGRAVVGTGDWASAVARARKFVAGLTLEEKINVTTGIDIVGAAIPRLGWDGLCLQDSPLGVRIADLVSAFPAGINAAATWDVDLIEARGRAMGAEFRGKGVHVALGPMTNMGRQAAAGRNWEGFGADPFLSGVATVAAINGIQKNGVIATVKHFIANEQEHFRGGSEASQIYSSNIDDKTFHEVRVRLSRNPLIHSLYLWPFAEAVHAGVGAVMCAYNKINQTQACQNSKIINGVLKEELGFMGFIMSDWAAMIDGVQPALAGLDMNMPGFFAYGRGPQNETDPANAVNGWWGAHLGEMVRNGSVPEARVDDMVIRTFAAYYKMGQDKGFPPMGIQANAKVNVQADHFKLIREIGAASTVLLKNTGNALPLRVKNLKRIAIVGSDAGPNPDAADATRAHSLWAGDPEPPTSPTSLTRSPPSPRTSSPSTPPPTVGAVLNDFDFNAVRTVASTADACLVFVNADSGEGYITVHDNRGDNMGDRANITLWHGGEALIGATAAVCANTVVVQHTVGPVTMEGWIDHPNVTAVLHAGLPGQESGNALATNPSGRLPYTIAKARGDYPADILYVSGDGTPQLTYGEGLGIDYRWFDSKNIAPRFEFGFGLSYTTFGYSGLTTTKAHHRREADAIVSSTTASSTKASSTVSGGAAPSTQSVQSSLSASDSVITASASTTVAVSSLSASVSANATGTLSAPSAGSTPVGELGGPAALYESILSVSFRVQNTGHVAGSEVSQLYLSFPEGYGEPPKVLRGFARTLLQRGQSKTVTIPLRVKDVSVWDVVSQKWVVPKGTFTVQVGGSSRVLPLTGTFTM
ncbi:glycoside hydrolase superfamily [Mycena olivaceomarginata]|nr:glycoside hydrolase superfamily [Mycena olivaceomarginata]